MRSATQTVEELYAAFARGDLPAVMALIDTDVQISPPTLPWSRGDYAGPDGVAQYFQSFAEALDDAAVEPHELIEGGATAFADSR
jgi:uncharacterized protein